MPPSDQFVPVVVNVPIAITDDGINEAEEVFVVILELVAAQNPDKVDLNVRNVSLCTIGDNDRKYWQTTSTTVDKQCVIV